MCWNKRIYHLYTHGTCEKLNELIDTILVNSDFNIGLVNKKIKNIYILGL